VRLAAAGSLTGLTCETIFYPLDAINVNTKVFKDRNVPMAEMAKIMWQKERFNAFYKGYTATLYGSVAYGCLYFASYRKIKHMLGEYTTESQLG